MKIKINQKELESALNKVKSAVATSNDIPILKGVYFTPGQVIATDLELGIKAIINSTIERKGQTVFPPDIFNIVKQMPNRDITIEVDDNYKATISCNDIQINLDCYQPDEYPELPKVAEPETLELDSRVLQKAINRCIVSASDNPQTPALDGLLFSGKDVVSTNTYRLSLEKLDNSFGDRMLIVPQQSAKPIASMCQEVVTVNVEYADNYAKFNFGDTVIISRLIEGRFPDYNQVIPKEKKTKIIAGKKDLLNCLKRAQTLANKDSGVIKLVFKKNVLNVTTSCQTSKFDESLPVEIEGENQSVNVDVNFFIDGVKLPDNDEVEITMENSLSPVVIKEASFIYLIMPVRDED